MRNTIILSAVALLTVAFSGPVTAASICNSTSGNVVTNCGFESGTFSGWAVTGNLQGGVGGNYVYVDNGNPNSGNYDGYFGAQTAYGQNGTGSTTGPVTTLSQTLATLSSTYYQLSFYLYNSGCGSTCTGQYYEYFDVYFNNVLLTAQTNTDTGGGYELLTFSGLTSGSVTSGLQFDFVNDDAAYQLDDVIVKATGPTPEPASLLLVGSGVAGLYYFSRRRRKA